MRAYHRLRQDLEIRFLDRPGARRVLHHAGLGPAFRNGHSCRCSHARGDQEVDQDLPVNRQRRQLGVPERGGA